MKKNYLTFKQARDMFFDTYTMYKSERKRGKKQNQFTCDCRTDFCDFVDSLHKEGLLSDKQRYNITLIG